MTKDCIFKENNKGHPQGKPNRSFVFKLQMKPGNCQCGCILFLNLTYLMIKIFTLNPQNMSGKYTIR